MTLWELFIVIAFLFLGAVAATVAANVYHDSMEKAYKEGLRDGENVEYGETPLYNYRTGHFQFWYMRGRTEQNRKNKKRQAENDKARLRQIESQRREELIQKIASEK